ncbi:MAG: spore cortex-lytic enzyme [Clostridiales bacterium]|nr:spore cortex-lytic enzyme [Clostridiales bacterium]
MKKLSGRFVRTAVFVLAVSLLLTCSAVSASAASYRQGDSGDTVVTIQTKLKRWGYYTGAVDGIYGSATVSAVKYFQRSNGLTADGVVGAATLKALGMEGGGATNSSATADVALLAKVISAEARGEPYSGQVAVGAVILNRVNNPSFPNTIAGVVYEPGAFTCMVDGQIDQPVADSAYQAARDALNGADPSGGALYYFNPDTATSAWIWSRPLITVIGKHRFCA